MGVTCGATQKLSVVCVCVCVCVCGEGALVTKYTLAQLLRHIKKTHTQTLQRLETHAISLYQPHEVNTTV